MGRLENVRVAQSARRLEVLPYVVSSLHRGPSEPRVIPSSTARPCGRARRMDVSYGLGANFTLDATINPDFGQVEADPAVINLSAFETFFEERRPFLRAGRPRLRLLALGRAQPALLQPPSGSLTARPRVRAGRSFSDIPENATIQGAAKLSGRTASGISVGCARGHDGERAGEALYSDGSTGSFLVEPRSEYGTLSVAQGLPGRRVTDRTCWAPTMRRELPGRQRDFDWLPSSAFSGGVRFNHQWNDRDWAVYGYLAGSHVRADPRRRSRESSGRASTTTSGPTPPASSLDSDGDVDQPVGIGAHAREAERRALDGLDLGGRGLEGLRGQ